MPDNERSWVKWIIAALLGGAITGYLVSALLKIVLANTKWIVITNWITPIFVILSLLFVLAAYTKEKEDTL